MAKVAELALEQARGSKLKTAKEDELSALGDFRITCRVPIVAGNYKLLVCVCNAWWDEGKMQLAA